MYDDEEEDEVPCKKHPDAPHGFCRNASHSAGRYVCECEFWEPQDTNYKDNSMKTVFETQTYQVLLKPTKEEQDYWNYELVNKLYDVVEYTCMSLPQAIETAKMYEHYLQQDAEQPDLFEEYAKTAGTLQ